VSFKNHEMRAINGDCHINGDSGTPEDAIAYAERALVMAQHAIAQRARVKLMAESAGLIDPQFHQAERDSMEDPRV